tara:strand:+ start:305 stop:487 length:183 start_codon:yes stop_codon:yes gene_type:complete
VYYHYRQIHLYVAFHLLNHLVPQHFHRLLMLLLKNLNHFLFERVLEQAMQLHQHQLQLEM